MIGARVRVVPKRAVLDPQGEAVLRGLHQLGHDLVRDVRDATHPIERAMRHGVEVDAPFVGLLGVGAA